ncbi:MAG: hypothetical protein LBI40_00670 [Treponema sp.]|jgi:beta-glucuronidase|nr:hypothetical protein [Treponema sp.]
MGEKPGNYQAEFHNTDYETEYLSPRLDASGLINLAGRKTESLNGKWNFTADLYDTCRRAHWFKGECFDTVSNKKPVDWDWEGWSRISVPASWNLERPELLYFEGFGVYTRTFRYTPQYQDERLFLCFEGVAYSASIFLNGVFVGSHNGASTPFNVDISEKIKTDNRIIVVADARRSPYRIPMENMDWFNYGGIYRDIYLVRTPKVFIKDWFIRLVPDGTYTNIAVDIVLSENIGDSVLLEIPGLSIREKISIQNGYGSLYFCAKPELWSPEVPKLYDVLLTYNIGMGRTDVVCDTIGFREIRVNGHDILLNGKKIFLKGISVHEDHIILGKTTNDEIIRSTIRDLKEMHGNYLRLAHDPHSRRFAEIASEEGVMLWEEIPVYWAIAFDNPDTYQDAENQLTELILRDRNRASVILWSVGNENADTDSRLTFMSKLAQMVKSLDDSRLVSAACLINHKELQIQDRLTDFLDVIGINEYYGWYDPDISKLSRILINSEQSKPVVICEFGGDARLGQRGSTYDLFTEDKQKAVYDQQITAIKQCPYIAGITPWILYDFRSPRRSNRYQQGFNRKGIIDADRKSRKLSFDVMCQFYKGF